MAGIRASRIVLLGIAAWLSLAGAARSGEPVVSSVSFQAASPYQLSYGELSALVTLKAGDPLSPEVVRESIRRLGAKSVFREVTAYVRELDGKADVVFYLRPVPVIVAIDVEGEKALSAAQIVAESRIRRGTPLPEGDLAGARGAVESFLARKGFLDGKVSVEATCNVSNGSGAVRIVVKEGKPATVKALEVSGASALPRERIAEILGVVIGGPFDFRSWEGGLPLLISEYKRAGYLTVRVEPSAPPCGEGGGLCPRVVVAEGKRYDVRWDGVRRIRPDKLAKAIGLYDGEETTEGVLLYELKDRILSHYRSEGYLEAEADVSLGEESEGSVPLVVTVREGMRGHIEEIRFEGNHAISEKTLRKQMLTRKRGPFHWITGSGKYDAEEWERDLKAVIGYYQTQGFIRMKIAGVDNQWDASGGIVKTVLVDEGPRYRLEKIEFRGNDHFLKEEFLARMRNGEGRFVDYIGLDRDQEAIASMYLNAGFLDAVVEGELDIEGGPDNAVARFRIKEGVRYRLGTVVVQGNVLTRARAVLRENPIAPGDFAGEEGLLKFQQSVYATGLYRSVRLQRIKRPAEGVVDLIVEVDETLFLDVEFGAGYGTETGIRGSVYAKERNLDGLGRSLSGRAMVGQREQNYQVELREPYVLGDRWKWEGVLSASHLFQERPSFSLRKEALIAGLQREIMERSTLSLQYEFSVNQTVDVEPGAVISEEDQGRANLASVRALLVVDFRDDPFNPRKGTFLSGGVELGSEAIGSQVNFWSVTGQAGYYLPFVRRNSIALSARAGVIQPYGTTTEVPIQRRFFAGGRTTVRGFDQDSLGPRGADGAPTGGNYQLILNGELRFPLQYGFLAATFVDAGSVWRSRDPVSGFDLRESAGLSLRYITPVGPISLDYGWKLDRRPGESPSELSFTIGMVF
ncbi:MAG: outer membrane protein assembly factor BamA [Thermodesulfobacteriota bacterium]